MIDRRGKIEPISEPGKCLMYEKDSDVLDDVAMLLPAISGGSFNDW